MSKVDIRWALAFPAFIMAVIAIAPQALAWEAKERGERWPWWKEWPAVLIGPAYVSVVVCWFALA